MAKKRRKANLKNPRSTTWRNRADALWRTLVRARWGGLCAICGQPGRDAHHLIRRDVGAYRHHPDNGVFLCALHHLFCPRTSAHGSPLNFADKLAARHPGTYAWWNEHRFGLPEGKPDYRAAAERLEELLKEMAE